MHPANFHVGALTRCQLAFVPPILCSRIWSCFRTVDTDVDTAALDTSIVRARPGGLIGHEHQSTTDFLGTAPEWCECHGVLKSAQCVEFNTVGASSAQEVGDQSSNGC